MLNIGVLGYAAGALLFLIMGLVLMTGQRGRRRKTMLMLASVASALWLGETAYALYFRGSALLYTNILELIRDLAWIAFLTHILASRYSDPAVSTRRFRRTLMISAAFVLLLSSMAVNRFFGGSAANSLLGIDWLIAGGLVVSIFALVLIEQLCRNTRPEARRAVKYVCMGIGGIFAYDFYLYSEALLLQRINPAVWEARGFVNALVVPVIGIGIARDPRSSLEIFVSRRVVFHTTTLLGAGIYLLAMGAGGYYVRLYGGNWGTVAQAVFLFGAILLLAILLFSDQVRARLRVFISKHFFPYRYDYRDEWLRFIATLASGKPDEHLRERAVRAIAEIIDSTGGILWMRNELGRLEPVANWNMALPANATETARGSLVKFLESREWVIDLDEFARRPELYTTLELPLWLSTVPKAWLITPLMLHSELTGFVLLARSHARKSVNWEDCDLLKTVGREAASHLAQFEASQALSEARQFEMCSRLSTYVMHDLKNLIAQLSLVVTNAAKHKNNPQFMEDAISTVEHSVQKMNRLLAQLRSGGTADSGAEWFDLCELLSEVAQTMGNGRPVPSVDCQVTGIGVYCNRERCAAVIGHVVRNAQDATPDEGKVMVRLFKSDDMAVIEVQDTGCGMDEAFIRERLFKPFETTKGTSGTGIGAYESREFIRAMGGNVEVISRVEEGTTFRLRVPISDRQENNVKLRVVGESGQTDDGQYQEIAGR